jgi:hypothetical protein
MISTKVEYFSEIWYCTFQGPTLSGVNVAHTLEVFIHDAVIIDAGKFRGSDGLSFGV